MTTLCISLWFLSFLCSIHRQQWPFVMAELQMMTIERRARRFTVALRNELYSANLLPSFMDHASRWRHVLSELQHTFGYRHNDTVHDIQPESWDDECNIGAAFLEHRRVWMGVMTELLRRPVTPSHVEHRRVWLDVMAELLHRPVTPSHVERRRVWLGVKTELLRRPVTPSHDAMSDSAKSVVSIQ